MKYFTADTHFGHKKLKRPYLNGDTINHMVNACKDFNKGDHLYILGDIAWDLGEFKEFVDSTHCHIHIIPGNHDSLTKLEKFVTRRVLLHSWIHEIPAKATTTKVPYILCHFPLVEWSKQFYGSIHLHGHSHGTIVNRSGLRCMDVGLDATKGKLISEEFIAENLATIPYDNRYKPTMFQFERVTHESIDFVFTEK